MHLIIPLPPCTQSQSFVGHTRKVFYDWYYSRLDPVIHASDHAAVNGKKQVGRAPNIDLWRTAVLREAWATLPESSSRPLPATLAQTRNLAHASLETAVYHHNN